MSMDNINMFFPSDNKRQMPQSARRQADYILQEEEWRPVYPYRRYKVLQGPEGVGLKYIVDLPRFVDDNSDKKIVVLKEEPVGRVYGF